MLYLFFRLVWRRRRKVEFGVFGVLYFIYFIFDCSVDGSF